MGTKEKKAAKKGTKEKKGGGGKKDGKRDGKKQRRSGPRLPSSLRKELDDLNHDSSEDEVGGEAAGEDVYEYEEGIAQEETKKNRRFDPVENYEYELPSDFEDEDVPSGDEDDSSDGEGVEKDDDRNSRMLEGITGMPAEAFQGKKRRKVVLSTVTGDTTNEQLSIQDLLDPLHGKPGYSKLRKRMDQLEKKPMAVQALLPKVERERVERKVAYEHTKKDITKWEPLVKRNREATTLIFEDNVDLGYSTVGAIASEFKPRSEFEKKMALLVGDPEVAEAHRKDGARLLELNKVSVEDVRERQNHVAKMRSLLFCHEMKSKRMKRIKSKTYHRIAKKQRQKAASGDMPMDPEAAKEYALKQEFKRAEERLTLKHKNSSKWAKRILKRGLDVQDEGTRAAISEQLSQHALLTRKMNSMKDSSSSDDSSDDDVDDEFSPETESEGISKLLNRAKEKTIKLIEDKDEIPKSGVLSLPFMERHLKKQQEAAYEEARLALEEYESALRQPDTEKESESPKSHQASGRKVFGTTVQQSQTSTKRVREDNIGTSDSEDNSEFADHVDVGHEAAYKPEKVQIAPSFVNDRSQVGQEAVFKRFDDIIKDPGPQTAYEVAIFASNSWKKMKGGEVKDGTAKKPATIEDRALHNQDTSEMDRDSKSDSDEEMVDGVLSSVWKSDYELPSQADLIHRAFAGDDVEAEFEKSKMDILNEENPEPEKPVLLPGWGQWTHVQRKKGLPSRMIQEHENAKRKREKALKDRKDAHLKHVIISERSDKKAEKLYTKNVPHPFSSKEVFEQSIRMPIGPEYNPAISVGALNRPAIVKRAGTIINPIKFEEVDPYAKEEEPRRILQNANKKTKTKSRSKNTKPAKGKALKKSSVKSKS